ncbi:hypothetical protein GCM10009584_16020 [Ornithinimicrobium humiphilum]
MVLRVRVAGAAAAGVGVMRHLLASGDGRPTLRSARQEWRRARTIRSTPWVGSGARV